MAGARRDHSLGPHATSGADPDGASRVPWVASDVSKWCHPLRGRHREGCHHRLNLVPMRVGILSEWLFGQAGGSQARQVRGAIEGLALLKIVYKRYGPDGPDHVRGPLISLSPVTEELSYWFWEDGIRRQPDYVISFAPAIHESLMAGRYQRIPSSLAQGLSSADFLLWLTVLCQVPVGRLPMTGEDVTLSLTGRRPAIEPWRFHWDSLTHRRLGAALDRAVERGNELQDTYVLEHVELPPARARVKTRVAVVVRRRTGPEKSGS